MFPSFDAIGVAPFTGMATSPAQGVTRTARLDTESTGRKPTTRYATGTAPASGRRPTMTELPGLDVAELTAWLAEAHPDLADAPLTASIIAGGRSNLTYAVDGARVPLIVRRPPLGHVLSSAHDMGREHRVISALAGT